MSGDYGDQAKATEERMWEIALRNHQQAAKKHRKALPPTGKCLNCGESEYLPDPEARYCDKDCQEDHEKRLAGRSRSGKL